MRILQALPPCPAGLDVALINKYYDLARLGDGLAREHYLTPEKRAGDCVGCGHCHGRCPFHVAQSSRMQEILSYFGAQSRKIRCCPEGTNFPSGQRGFLRGS